VIGTVLTATIVGSMGDVGVGLGETALAADLAAELASEGARAVAEGETGNAVASSSCLADKVFSSKSLGVRSRLFGNDGIKYTPTTKLSVGGDLNGARAGGLNSRGFIRIGWSVLGREATGT
jgi:hypothetical protein